MKKLLTLVLDIIVISRLKLLNDISMKFLECLNKEAKKKKGLSVYQC